MFSPKLLVDESKSQFLIPISHFWTQNNAKALKMIKGEIELRLIYK